MDNFIKLERVGTGSGNIKVYKVKDLRSNKIFALKKIPYDKKTDSENTRKYIINEVTC